jgi:hypothetical protein
MPSRLHVVRLEPFAKQAQDLLLARSEMVEQRCFFRLARAVEWNRDAEDADDLAAVPQRRRRGPERDRVAEAVDHPEVVDPRGLSDHLARKVRPRERTMLGHDRDHERLPAPVSEQLDVGPVEPAVAAFPIDHVRGRGQILHRPRKIQGVGQRFFWRIPFLHVEALKKEPLPVAPPRAAGREDARTV